MLYSRRCKVRASRQAGFTLMELVGALVLLGLIYALYASSSGPVLQIVGQWKGATKITGDLQQIYDQAQNYLLLNGNMLPADAGQNWKVVLRTAGLMDSIPKVGSDMGWDGSYPIANFGYALDGATYSGWGDNTITDTAIVLAGVSALTCAKINGKFSNMINTSSIPSAVDYTIGLQCFQNGTTYTVVRPVYFDATRTTYP